MVGAALGKAVFVAMGTLLGVIAIVAVALIFVALAVGNVLDVIPIVTVPFGATDGMKVGVFDGSGVFVNVGGKVGGEVAVEEGCAVNIIVGVGVFIGAAEKIPNTACGNIKKTNTTINAMIVMPLAIPPAFVG